MNIIFFSSYFTVWKGPLQLYLWHWSIRLSGCILSAKSYGDEQRHVGIRNLRSRLLSAANGHPVWHQRHNVSPVSTVPVIKLHSSGSQKNRATLQHEQQYERATTDQNSQIRVELKEKRCEMWDLSACCIYLCGM